jgi:hypothetical protein
MYNRYIPQPDGSYRKNRMSEPEAARPPQRQRPGPQNHQNRRDCSEEKDPCCIPPPPEPKPCKTREPQHTGILDYFRNLFPGELDTGDLLVIILLLLMAGDCKGNDHTALLTLVLYLLM